MGDSYRNDVIEGMDRALKQKTPAAPLEQSPAVPMMNDKTAGIFSQGKLAAAKLWASKNPGAQKPDFIDDATWSQVSPAPQASPSPEKGPALLNAVGNAVSPNK